MYTKDDASFDDGVALIDKLCGEIVAALQGK
jgi:hypothetical protein